MPLILGTNSIKDTGYDVANSCRFDRDSTHKLHKTLVSSTDADKFTVSFWVKLARFANSRYFFSIYTDSNNETSADIQNDNTIRFYNYTSGSYTGQYVTNRVLRDPSAWYHLIFVYDSGNATAGNRIRLYINGVEETSFSTEDNPNQDQNSQNTTDAVFYIGDYGGGSYGQSAYISEFCFIDGQALTPTSFGEFDSDSPTIWKPIDVSGLTFGNNGFYLDFEDSSNLGNDVNGGTDLTEVNLAATDQSLDTCTNNFCTMNPLDNYYAGATFSEGNLKFVHGSSAWCYNTATFGLSSGKWYWEMKCVDAGSGGGGDQPTIGIANKPPTSNANYLGENAYAWGYRAYPTQRNVISNGAEVLGSLSQYTDGDIIGVYMDLDNNKLYFSKNGTLENSTGISLTAPSSTPTGVYFPAAGDNTSSASATWEANFGSPSFSISSGNTDDNGYGNFEYSPNITGDSTAKKFYACNTKNLAEFG